MSQEDSTHGLNCPNCGGMVNIPEGQAVVRCPYCEMRSLVRGERGMRRYQVRQRIGRENASQALKHFFSKNWAIARDAARQAHLTDIFQVYLPFWCVWGRAAAWAFGQKKVGSGDRSRYEPREIRIVQEMTWNGPACDVGEFGVTRIDLPDQALEPFDPDALHAVGLVFEPVGSFSAARAAAEDQFQEQVRRKAALDRLSQLFVRYFRRRFGLVYFPLWILRYQYRGRSFQVVVDGYSGKVLYGKAPGNTLYRAAALVLGMALGAFLAVDASTFALTLIDSDDGSGAFGLALVLFLAGLGVMLAAYRAFRYGEQFEYRSGPKPARGTGTPLDQISNEFGSMDLGSIKVKDLEQWISRLS